MAGISSLLDIGKTGLFANQTALEVTSNNIANVNTVGYSRRSLLFEEGQPIDFNPGQLGTGVRGKEIIRHFDKFIEASYNDKASLRERWQSLYNNLRSVESLFNESTGIGISSTISTFFNDWQNLSQQPEDYPSRQALISDTKTMVNTIHQVGNDLVRMQEQVDSYITQEMNTANDLMKDIASINKEINIHLEEGRNNPNTLYDDRATKVRELAETIDVRVFDNGAGNFLVTTKAGQALVDGQDYYKLSYEAAKSFSNLTQSSTFEGAVYFEGNDDFEYTLEVTDAGFVSDGSSAAQFKVSLDGGQTWIKDSEGRTREFSCRSDGSKVTVGDLQIWFGSNASSAGSPSGQFAVGDSFNIVPKKGLYWESNTSGKENITPLVRFDGTDDPKRISGGKLAAYFNFRDDELGRFKEKMDTFSKEFVWQVNRLHSQGAGLETHGDVEGTYQVNSADRALASDSTGLAFGDKISSGSSMLYVYNSTTGELASGAALNYAASGFANFDPDQHTLNDVAAAVNRTFTGLLTANVVNNSLQITAESGYGLHFGADTTGVYAALGLNTFFQGDSSSTMELNTAVRENMQLIATGHVNGADEANPGDNTTALALADLQNHEITTSTTFEGSSTQTLIEYYNGIVSGVGTSTATAEFNSQYEKSLADELDARQQEISGVNLDEEMGNLIKFQHSYTAAAKLISTADRMLGTLMGMVR